MNTLHYVAPCSNGMYTARFTLGGHGGHVSGHRGENGMDVGQRRAAGWTKLGGRDCRDCRARFKNYQKFATRQSR